MNDDVPRSAVEDYFFGSPAWIAEKILLVKREARLAAYRACLAGCVDFGSVWHGVTGKLRGEPLTVIACGIGPSQVGDCAYALDRPGAVCLYAGTCGSLIPSFAIGMYGVAVQSICGDGYSLLLGHAPFSPVAGDAGLCARVLEALLANGAEARSATTFTTASVVRESEVDFWRQVSPGCQAIEMGAASFYAACRRTGKHPAAYFWVVDQPALGKSFYDALPEEDLRRKEEVYRQSAELDLEVLRAVI